MLIETLCKPHPVVASVILIREDYRCEGGAPFAKLSFPWPLPASSGNDAKCVVWGLKLARALTH